MRGAHRHRSLFAEHLAPALTASAQEVITGGGSVNEADVALT